MSAPDAPEDLAQACRELCARAPRPLLVVDVDEVLALGNRQVNSRAYVARFNFGSTDQQKKVGTLSGGERNRV